MGFAFKRENLKLGFVELNNVASIRSGVRKCMERVKTVRNAARQAAQKPLLKFSQRPGPAPNDSRGRVECPFGLSAGA